MLFWGPCPIPNVIISPGAAVSASLTTRFAVVMKGKENLAPIKERWCQGVRHLRPQKASYWCLRPEHHGLATSSFHDSLTRRNHFILQRQRPIDTFFVSLFIGFPS